MGIMVGKHVLCKKMQGKKTKQALKMNEGDSKVIYLYQDEEVTDKKRFEKVVRQSQRSIYFCSDFNLTLISKQLYFHNELYTFLFVEPLSHVCLLSM